MTNDLSQNCVHARLTLARLVADKHFLVADINDDTLSVLVRESVANTDATIEDMKNLNSEVAALSSQYPDSGIPTEVKYVTTTDSKVDQLIATFAAAYRSL